MENIQAILFQTVHTIFQLSGWWGVAGMLVVESATGISPGIMLLGLAGWQLILANGQPFLMVLLGGAIAALASTLGALVPYWFSRQAGRPALDRISRRLKVKTQILDRLDGNVQRWGAIFVLVGRIIPSLRWWVSIPAGLARMPMWKFFLASLAGSYIWYTSWIAVGYGFGKGWSQVSTLVLDRLPLLAAVAGVGLLLLVLQRFLRQRRLVVAPVSSGD